MIPNKGTLSIPIGNWGIPGQEPISNRYVIGSWPGLSWPRPMCKSGIRNPRNFCYGIRNSRLRETEYSSRNPESSVGVGFRNPRSTRVWVEILRVELWPLRSCIILNPYWLCLNWKRGAQVVVRTSKTLITLASIRRGGCQIAPARRRYQH